MEASQFSKYFIALESSQHCFDKDFKKYILVYNLHLLLEDKAGKSYIKYSGQHIQLLGRINQ